jgi:hypothetical protein
MSDNTWTIIFWLFVIIVGVIWYVNASKNKGNMPEANKQEANNQGEAPKSKYDPIYQEIEKKKEKARQLGLPEMMVKLYHDYSLKHFPSWITNSSVKELQEFIQSAKYVGKKGFEDSTIDIVFKNKTFRFKYKEDMVSPPDGDFFYSGDLDLIIDGQKVLSVGMFGHPNEAGGDWSAHDVEAFLEGDWINGFKELYSAVEKWDKDESEKFDRQFHYLGGKEETDEAVDKLKKDFGM